VTTYNKPLPRADIISKDFWEAAKRHELIVQRCQQCNEHILYPRQICPRCLSSKLEWVKVSGKGRIYTHSVIYQPAHPGFVNDIPYVLAIIELDEGPRILSNIVECVPEDVKVDMPVTAVFDDVTPEVTLIKFKPAA